jgi:erythromycin esterase-like protein
MPDSAVPLALLDDWIARAAISFSLEPPASFDTAVDRLVAALDPAIELLGIGEPLHGGEDFLVLRNRLFRRLVERHGYSAIAVESSFPRGRRVNQYIAEVAAHSRVASTSSYADVQAAGFSHNFGLLDANRELVEWMRRRNAEAPAAAQLRFYGFDGPMEMMSTDSPRQVLTFTLDYLAELDPAAAGLRRERIEPLLGSDAAWETTEAAFDPTKSIGLSAATQSLRIETEDLLMELAIRRPELTAESDADRYAEAVHSGELARRLLNYHAAAARTSDHRVAEMLGIRDAIMAANLEYIARRERGRGKVLVFAHNGHLKLGQTDWQLGPHTLRWWPAGAQLRESLGARYAVIGGGVGTSDENGMGSPEAGTLEARLLAAPGPGRFIPTRRGSGMPVDEIAALPTRSGSKKNSTYFPLTPQSVYEFDWLVMLDRTTYNRGGPPLPGSA